jgi:transcriptional regulator with GAF, ATPase, and Fis domain
MVESLSLAERMAAAARDLQDQGDPRQLLEAAVRLAVDNVGGADAAAISVVQRRRQVETFAQTAEYVVKADRLQYELQEGPCLDAVWEERVVHSPDLREERRWPTWAPRVVEEMEVRSMLCFQLFTHEDTVGALNLYAREPQAFDARDRDDGLALAAHIAVATVAAQKIEHLETAVESRTVIGQAVGMLMERFDLGSERAFALLVRISSHANRKLRDIAEDVVARRDLEI